MTRAELGDRAERLVCSHFDGELALRGQRGYDLVADGIGRVQVKARSRGSRHLNWFHVRNVHLREFDYLVLVEFEGDGRTVAGAWGMPWADVLVHSHSTIKDARGDLTKLAVRGEWKQRVERIPLNHAESARP